MPNEDNNANLRLIGLLLADLRWWGNAIAGNGPVGGYARAAKDAESHWYGVTLPMLYKLNAVYAYETVNFAADLSETETQLAAYLPNPPYLSCSEKQGAKEATYEPVGE